jgi:DNA anti-recombination protein RmuC
MFNSLAIDVALLPIKNWLTRKFECIKFSLAAAAVAPGLLHAAQQPMHQLLQQVKQQLQQVQQQQQQMHQQQQQTHLQKFALAQQSAKY